MVDNIITDNYIATNNRDGRGVPKEADDVIMKITPIGAEGEL